MKDLAKQFASLSPEKQKLLKQLLEKKGVDTSTLPILPQNRGVSSFPLSFAQQRLWFLDQLEPGNPAYNIPLGMTIEGPLDTALLAQCLNNIVKRHEILRTVFTRSNGIARQSILTSLEIPLEIENSTAFQDKNAENADIQNWITHTTRKPFSLDQAPLINASLLRINSDKHIFLVTLHHIIADRWSAELLVRELMAYYEGKTGNGQTLQPELTIQYADFSVWQCQQFEEGSLDRSLNYWKRELADVPVLELPVDHQRPSIQSYRGGEKSFDLSLKLSKALRKLSQREGCTLFMTLLAAFNVLLFRYTGQSDIVLGAPIANRNRPEIAKLIGLFVNMLVLRTTISDAATFRELLQHVRGKTLTAYDHQDLPFERLVDALNLDRDLGMNPLFQVVFAFREETPTDLEMLDLTINFLDIHTGNAQFDLCLLIKDSSQGLTVAFEYNTDLFDETTIDRMLHHFDSLLQSIVTNPNQALKEVELLGENERRQLVFEYNKRAENIPEEVACIGQILDQSVASTPDAVAIVSDNREVSYKNLNGEVNRLANYLILKGINPEDVVGICCGRNLDYLIGALAVMKAGGVYMPMDPNHPRERLDYMLANANASMVMTQEPFVDHFSGKNIPVVNLDNEKQVILQQSDSGPKSNVEPENLAYVIYTSGSTGKPKGVGVSHKAVVQHLFTMHDEFELTAEDRVLLFASFTFDISVEQLLAPLFIGATVVLLGEQIWGSSEFLKKTDDLAISVFNITPPVFHQIVDEMSRQNDLKNNRLRLVIIGGDTILPQAIRTWQHSSLSNVRLLNAYGPTEAIITSTCFEFPESFACNGKPVKVPIGKPVANKTAYVLDHNMSPVPIGCFGELFLGGDSIAQGYLNNPVLTAEKFVPDPFKKGGTRLYRTGDMVRFLPDTKNQPGDIEFLERTDHQVKIRGFRIELGEVEAALADHSGVNEAVVVVWEEEPGRKRLVAYVVLKRNAHLTMGELRNHLKAKLPGYMVPGFFIPLDSLPLNSSGKVDRSALPIPADLKGDSEITFEAPRSHKEETLALVWSQVLKASKIGIHDNFFELGGDSILSIQMVSKARELGLKITPKQIFQSQTIAELAIVVDGISKHTLNNDEINGPVPLTPIQSWFFEQEFTNPNHWNQAVLLELAPADPEFAEKSINELVKHHHIFRLNYSPAGDNWQQISHDEEVLHQNLEFIVFDLSGKSEQKQRLAVEKSASEVQAGLNIQSGPLLRVAYFDLGDQKAARLLIVIHHLLVDGVSWRILIEDFNHIYQQCLNKRSPTLPLASTSFQTWASRLSEYAQTELAIEESDYWLNRTYEHVPSIPVDLALDATTPTTASSRTVSVMLTREETATLLRDVHETYHTQINDILLSALLLTFVQWTGEKSLLIDLEGHGREEIIEDVDLSRTIGWFTSSFPVLLELLDEKNPGAVIKEVKEQLRQIPNKGMTYGLLRYLSTDTDVAEELKELPKAEVIFNYLGQLDQSIDVSSAVKLASEDPGAQIGRDNKLTHLISIIGSIVEGKFRLEWTFSENTFKQETIRQLAKQYENQLKLLINHCSDFNAGGFTPSDFPLADIDQTQLDGVIGDNHKLIEDMYPLSPSQQGLLFHSLMAPESGVYVQQLSIDLSGDLNMSAFEKAWQAVVDRYPVLRTLFIFQDLKEPLQLVHKHVPVSLMHKDWSNLAPDEQELKTRELLQSDRSQGFDFSSAPLMRLYVIRLGRHIQRFIWSMHHILMDGWATPIVLRQVFEAYVAIHENRPVKSITSPPYQRYIAWLRNQDHKKAEQFWQDALKGFFVPTTLNRLSSNTFTSIYGSKDQKVTFNEQELRLSAEKTRQVMKLVRQHKLTLNSIMLGIWALLTGYYCDREDVIFGATFSGRTGELPDEDSMVGLFINTLPVRARLKPNMSFLSWLVDLQTYVVELQQYQYSSLVDIQKWSDLPGNTPLFDSIVVIAPHDENGTTSIDNESPGFSIQRVSGFEQTNYPLTVTAIPNSELLLQINYNCAYFQEETVDKILNHFDLLFNSLITDSNLRLNELADRLNVSDSERRAAKKSECYQLLDTFNQTRANFSNDTCVHDLFEAQVEKSPQGIAVSFEGHEITYEELNKKANQLAHYLNDHGIGPDSLVAICVERSLEMVVGLLGILKAGGAYIPLDPLAPAERLNYVLEDSQAELLLSQGNLKAALPSQEIVPVVYLDKEWERISPQSQENPKHRATPNNLAYGIYTSGSTGKPKCVMIDHQAICNHLIWKQDVFQLSDVDNVLQLTVFTFDVSVWEIFLPLITGARLILPHPEKHKDGSYLIQLISQKQDITLFMVPSMLQHLLEQKDIETCKEALKRVWIGAGALTLDLKYSFFKRLNATLYHGYGPTETTIGVTYTVCSQDSLGSAAIIPIGKPISNTQAYVLDEKLCPVPMGESGELYIGGDALARGYHRRPAKTAESFIPNPFSEKPGERLYKTGDQARLLPDDNGMPYSLSFLGRLDNQVKIQGFRVELEEIETVLAQHPSLSECAVMAREVDGNDSEKRLVAYVVPKQEVDLKTETLRHFLRCKLLNHMIPSLFVSLDSLPRHSNGKLNRHGLPVPDFKKTDAEFIAPGTVLEECLVDLWKEVLQLETIGVTDDFFELGGHSLMVTQLVSRIRKTFQIELPLKILFEASTIADLSKALIAHEVKPGQTEKIACTLKRIKGMSAEDLKKQLREKKGLEK